MELYDEDEEKKTMSAPRKKILAALIICVLLFIATIAMLQSLGKNKPKKLKLFADGKEVKITENLLFNSEEESNTYIALKDISKLLGYDFIEEDYLNKEEKNNKCYIQGPNIIIGFEADSKKIYKTSMNSNLNEQYMLLNNKIIKNNNEYYIALDDLNTGCEAIYSFSEKENRIDINSLNLVAEKYKTDLASKKTYTLNSDANNNKSILYGMLIVKDSTKKCGVINLKYEQVIGCVYDSIEFDEATQYFIVSDEKKYGVIDETGKKIIKPQYAEMSVISNTPLYYKVKYNNKYGVINKDGDTIVNKEYDSIGINLKTLNKYLCIIENIGDEDLTGIVVCKGNKYGIVNVKDKKEILSCTLDDIFYKEKDNGELVYYIKIEDKEKKLDDYLIELTIETVEL